MRKQLLGIVLCATVVATGCSKREAFEEGKKNQIGFSTSIFKPTKATSTDKNSLEKDGNIFKILALHTLGNTWSSVTDASQVPISIDNEDVTYTAPSWATSKSYYWPDNTADKMHFFAVSQGDNAATPIFGNLIRVSGAADVSFTIAVPDAYTSQKDVIAALALDKDKTSTSASGSAVTGRVGFTFKHVLSRIGIKGYTDVTDANVKYKIKEIKLSYSASSIKNNGSYSFIDGKTTSSGTTYMSSTGETLGLLGTNPEFDNSTKGNQLNDADSYLMIIPQDLSGNSSVISAVIKYEVSYDGGTSYGTESTTPAINLPGVNFETGKSYSYNLRFSLTQITFDVVSVEDWKEVNQILAVTPNAAGILAAISYLDGLKGSNSALKEFIVNIGDINATSLDLSTLSSTNFAAGDTIKLVFGTQTQAVTVTLPSSGWSQSGSVTTTGGTITLTKQ